MTSLLPNAGMVAMLGPTSDVSKTHPEADPLRGALPRFVPFVFFDEHTKQYLAVLDLEERATRSMDDLVLARFDGASGKIAQATSMRGRVEWKPQHALAGHLWLYDQAWVSPTPFAVLDASSLAKVGGPSVVKDALADAKRWLPD